MMNRRLFQTTAALSLVLGGAAIAASHVSKDVERAMNVRQGHMQIYAFNLGPLGAMAQDKMPYDAAVAARAAANLAAVANIDQAGYWVEGSDSSVENSKAKAEIWSDMADFDQKNADLAAAATTLAAVAGNDLDALKGAFGAVGGACGACHKAYRVSDN